MDDIFSDIFEGKPSDPMQAARRSMATPRRRRFYETAAAGEAEGAYAVLLDGRPVRTPARRLLAAPARSLADALAAEWQGQGEFVDPARMPLTRLANSIVDGVAEMADPVVAEIGQYLGSDLLFYRADGPERLLALQAQHWDSLLAWARDELGARFVMVQGVVFAAQPPESVQAAVAAVPRAPWALGALHSAMTLTGSALIALALAHGRIGLDDAWTAAHVDEDWNMEQWGRDDLALKRRAERFEEMQAAATVLRLTREARE